MEMWHLMPVPDGIELTDHQIAYHPKWIFSTDYPELWLIRRPLPPVPKPKSQRELDVEAFLDFRKDFPNVPLANDFIFFAGAIYARRTQAAP